MSETLFQTPAEFLSRWQALRRLTRKVIIAFPDDQLFTFAIGGMRSFGEMAKELLGLTAPMVQGIASGEWQPYTPVEVASKAELLARWDAATSQLDTWFARIPPERFRETLTVFGQFTGPVWSHFWYLVDNETHHRGQGYVYLRALGIEPPAFWDLS